MEMEKLTKLGRKVLPLKRCGAVIVAAGSASRMGGIDKVMAPLGGTPMVARTAAAFQNCDAIAEIVIVTRPDLIRPISALCAGMDKVRAVVAGGSSRQESVWLGLNALSEDIQLAAIHDGARPLVSNLVIDRTVRAANSYGAAAPAVPVKDTIKVVKGGLVEKTPERATLQAVQTPQVFDFDLLRGALKQAEEEKAAVTDDCSAVERLGMKVKIVEGDERNLKVTTPMDLKIAEMLLEEMQ
jgi:2-C-methyl-D-erythritol 4-phosphate cytidylyltransferase